MHAPRWPPRVFDAPLVFLLALAARLLLVVGSRGGPLGVFGYDPGVYYTAADALTFGRLPYADFTLLHPPGLMLALVPFAVLGRLSTDLTGFTTANMAFIALAALNAALVMRIAARMNLSRGACLAGGIFYAVWFGAIEAEISERLEPLGNFAFLCGVLALTGEGRRARTLALGGASLGLAASVKIWWILPVLMLLGWQLGADRSWRRIGAVASGVTAALLTINAPFFLAAPSAMWRMVVRDQLGRGRGGPIPARLNELSTLRWALPGLRRSVELPALALIGLCVAVAAALAWRIRAARPVVSIAVVQLGVLAVLSPTYFRFYSDFAAGALGLTLAAAAGSGIPSRLRLPGRLVAAGIVIAATVPTLIVLGQRPNGFVAPFPRKPLSAGAAGVRCLMADSPTALIELDALSRGLADHCPNWVDVTGRTYDIDASRTHLRRSANAGWQAALRTYLLSGDGVILIRGATGVSPALRRLIDSYRVVARSGGYTVRRIR